ASVNTLNAYNSWGGYSRDGNIGEDFTYCRAKSDDESQHPRLPQSIDTTDPVLTLVPFNSRHLTRAELWVLNWMQEQGFAYDVYPDLDWHYPIDSIDDYESRSLIHIPSTGRLRCTAHARNFCPMGATLSTLAAMPFTSTWRSRLTG